MPSIRTSRTVEEIIFPFCNATFKPRKKTTLMLYHNIVSTYGYIIYHKSFICVTAFKYMCTNKILSESVNLLLRSAERKLNIIKMK